jgi:dCMP deaminase
MLAKLAATRSTCISRPVGAVLVKNNHVLATGYNGSISGAAHCIEEEKCFRRAQDVPDDVKHLYCRSSHAEANIVAQAAKYAIDSSDSTLFITLYPCYTCYKLLCSAGIKTVYYESKYESVNVGDTFNKNFIENGPIQFFKLTISTDTLRYIIPRISEYTSTRNLKSE